MLYALYCWRQRSVHCTNALTAKLCAALYQKEDNPRGRSQAGTLLNSFSDHPPLVRDSSLLDLQHRCTSPHTRSSKRTRFVNNRQDVPVDRQAIRSY